MLEFLTSLGFSPAFLEFFTISLLNGMSYGLLLFMLSSGLTLIFSMMGVLNFAHASFYMLGAYFAFAVTQALGFWWALLFAPLMVGVLGAGFERFCLRRVHKFGHVPELLITFGLSYILLELVQLVWGRSSVDYRVPDVLDGPLFTLFGTQFPMYRGFMMLVAVLMLISIWLLLTRTRIGLIIQAALSHPEMAQALGHNVPRVFMLVFGGGAALAGLAGVIGGNAFVTEPGMAATVGSVIFVVVVVGGMGSLAGAFLASLLIGVLQTFAVAMDGSLMGLFKVLGMMVTPETFGYALWKLKLSQVAPILPYLMLVLMLIFRPRGLLGTREG
ncbi:MAG: branched-chain amino acid ABC transporter permease [Gammaproteobacteria bacterium]|nr:branched-chain amino acid ABC transporter permease [Gammaproteobacteria bacterium]MBU0788723.1 branched-chain amino acid ABC transporter permease [Gammaproteobacteria bacterium]MBU0814658.1 branched-chain amino acid ABC transporter permease [Gammaproteobacteria bacterium]MBU1786499.1 branched-chain amino acid ABC transporter permease [Gammaproteobacteria bacterium]